MLTPEGRVKEAVRKFLKAKGVWYYQPVQNGMGVVGIPDFVCCWHGRFIAIETKAPGKRHQTTPNQNRVLQEIHDHDGYVFVIDDVELLKRQFIAIEVELALQGVHHAEVHTPQAGLPEGLQRPTGGSRQAREEQRRPA